MSEKLSYSEILEKLPAYSLGALEVEEMLAVEAYLQQHAELLARFEQAEQAAAQLAHLAPDTPLPATNKQALMQRVRVDLAAHPVVSTKVERPRPQPERGKPAATGSWLANLQKSIRPARGWAIATGVAALLLLILGLYATHMQGRLRQIEAKVSQLQTANEQWQQNYQILQQQLQTEQGRLAFIANTSPANTVAVPGTDEAPQANGQLFVGDNNQALLAVYDLPPLPAQQTYQLWLAAEDEAVISAGLFAVTDESPSWVSVEIPAAAQNFTLVGVSIEPAEGSPAPTGPIVLLHTP